MGNIWDFLANVMKAINDFLDWYLHDTPLFEDTLNTAYATITYTIQQSVPLVKEYIAYLSEYFHPT